MRFARAYARFSFFMALAAWSGPAVAVEKAVDARLEMDSENPAVGERVEYRIRVAVPEGWELVVPESFDFAESFSAVKEEIRVLKRVADGEHQQELIVPLVIRRLGRLKIEERSFLIRGPDGAEESLTAGRIFLAVGTHFPNENNPEPGAPLAPVPLVERNWVLIWTLAVLGVVFLTILVTLLLVRLRPRKEPPPPPPRPAHVVALERLARLRRRELEEKGEYEPLYTELSELLREYLGLRWEFDSLDMTTTELLSAMGNQRIEQFVFQLLRTMMDDFDLVKFARAAPAKQDALDDMDRVEKLIAATRRAEGTARQPQEGTS